MKVFFSLICAIRFLLIALVVAFSQMTSIPWMYWILGIVSIEFLLSFMFVFYLYPFEHKLESACEYCYEWFALWVHDIFGEDEDDYTEGKFDQGAVSLSQSESSQRIWLLDLIDAKPGKSYRLLDIGCGNGGLLKDAKVRGIQAIGITTSATEAKENQRKGLDCREMNFWNMAPDFFGQFDGVVFNGSLEHMPRSFWKKEKEYKRLFEIVEKLFDPKSNVKKCAITCIHSKRKRKVKFTDLFHVWVIRGTFGGVYPKGEEGLVRCARSFDVLMNIDATENYQKTSDYWFRRIKENRRVFYRKQLLWAPLLLLVDPFFLSKILMVELESWPRQFRTSNPPVTHRQILLALK